MTLTMIPYDSCQVTTQLGVFENFPDLVDV